MDLSRRNFLGGVLTVSVVSMAPLSRLLPFRPKLMGDGFYDDADGLNALFRGEPFDLVGDNFRVLAGPSIELNGGHFLIGKTLKVPNCVELILKNFYIRTAATFSSKEPMLVVSNASRIWFENGRFDNSHAGCGILIT